MSMLKCGGFFFLGAALKYAKPPLSVEEQADRLLSRGLISSKEDLVSILSHISYYRLSGYLFPHREYGGDGFKTDTHLSTVFNQYLFDRQLRVLVMDAIERVEVSVKTKILNLMAQKHGPFAHSNRANFPGMSIEVHRILNEKIRHSTDRSNRFGEMFIQHYVETYTSETEVPLWMVMEIIDFGSMFTMFKHLEQYDQRAIAQAYGLRAGVLQQWLQTLNYVRNICAHHGRLWNRVLAIKPVVPAKKNCPEFHQPHKIQNSRVFAVLSLLSFMLQEVCPKSHWKKRINELMEKYPDIPLEWMGFPVYWKEYNLWSDQYA